MDKFDLYRDIAKRTGGDIYVGVVGPVRTGKSTLIKQVMQECIVDNIDNIDDKARAIDEIPQSADGKTIMTTQPRFVPNEAVRISIGDNLCVNMRLIDCVGYLVGGALGAEEDGKERMVSTPWSDDDMPFSKAAEIGTQKVIKEHSTIALAVTTDGSFSGIDRQEYVKAEERVISELKECGKPFVILLNVKDVNNESVYTLKKELEEKYQSTVIVKNALEMNQDDIDEVFASILMEFSVKLIDISLPRWVQALSLDSEVVTNLIEHARSMQDVAKLKDASYLANYFSDSEYWDLPKDVVLEAGSGRVGVSLYPKRGVFFKVLNDECGTELDDEYDLLKELYALCNGKEKTERLQSALEQVENLGYGIVLPSMSDIELCEPELSKHGNQYGVRLKASAPSLHIMRVDVNTEVNPIVGSEEHSKDLIESMRYDYQNNRQAVWDTNIFGRTLSSLVKDGIDNKLSSVPSDAQQKLRTTLTRIVNEGKGGVICILL